MFANHNLFMSGLKLLNYPSAKKQEKNFVMDGYNAMNQIVKSYNEKPEG